MYHKVRKKTTGQFYIFFIFFVLELMFCLLLRCAQLWAMAIRMRASSGQALTAKSAHAAKPSIQSATLARVA